MQEEIDKGFIRGPFSKPPFKQQNWSQEQLPPVSEFLLMRFIAFCETQMHLRYSTIKSYLCSICFFYLQKGGFNPLENFFGKPLPNLRIVLMGLKKKHSDFPKRVQLPITFDILHKMYTLLHKGVFNLFIDSLLEAACVVAFFGFLRCGEFTVLDQFNSDTNLCYNNVQVTNECTFLLLKKSKTDPFRYGITIPLFRNCSDICPVTSVQNYIKFRNSMCIATESFFCDRWMRAYPCLENFSFLMLSIS